MISLSYSFPPRGGYAAPGRTPENQMKEMDSVRLFSQTKVNKGRRGLSFIETVSSLVVIGLLGGAILATVAVLTQNTRETTMYTNMKVEIVNLIETIQSDLETGYEGGVDPIDSIDYNDNTGERIGFVTSVVVEDVGDVFGKPLYRVDITMKPKDNSAQIKTTTFLREGCTSYDD